MKTLVLYKSKWGSTEEYARFIYEQIDNSEIASLDKFKGDLKKYDLVVIGSRTFMGNIEGAKFLEENWEVLQTKKVYLFAVGMIDPNTPEGKAPYEKIPVEIRSKIRYIKVPGRVVKEKINFFENLIADARKLSTVDKVDMETVLPVVRYIDSQTVTFTAL